MSINQKITFDIVSLHAGLNAKPLPLSTTTKTGQTTWIDAYGGLHFRDIAKGEQCFEYSIDAQESFIKNGEKAIRTYRSISYYPEGLEGGLSSDERLQNLIARKAHAMVKEHQNVIVRGVDGGNVNKNQTGMLLFELRETSVIIGDRVEKTLKINEAMLAATDLFQNRPEEFINVCYMYSIQPIDGVAIQKLFNEVALKINNNPTHFLEILNHKDADLLILIKKGLIINSEMESIISFQDPFYFMNGENIGNSEDEILYNLKKSPRSKEFLMKSLNIPLEDTPEVINLPENVEAKMPVKLSQDYSRRTEAADMKGVTKMLTAMFNKYSSDIKASPENEEEITKKFKENLATKRAGYIEFADYWDTEVATKLKYA